MAKNKESQVNIRARSALLLLCLKEEHLIYIRSKKMLERVISVLSDFNSNSE